MFWSARQEPLSRRKEKRRKRKAKEGCLLGVMVQSLELREDKLGMSRVWLIGDFKVKTSSPCSQAKGASPKRDAWLRPSSAALAQPHSHWGCGLPSPPNSPRRLSLPNSPVHTGQNLEIREGSQQTATGQRTLEEPWGAEQRDTLQTETACCTDTEAEMHLSEAMRAE